MSLTVFTCQICDQPRRCVIVVDSTGGEVAACHVCRGHEECELCDEDAEACGATEVAS